MTMSDNTTDTIIGTLTRSAVASAIEEAKAEHASVKALIRESIIRRDKLDELIAALETVRHSSL